MLWSICVRRLWICRRSSWIVAVSNHIAIESEDFQLLASNAITLPRSEPFDSNYLAVVMGCTWVSLSASHVTFDFMSLLTRSLTVSSLFFMYLRSATSYWCSEGECGPCFSATVIALSFLNHKGPSLSFSISLRLSGHCHSPLCDPLSSSCKRFPRYIALTRACSKAYGH
jgi:hypothetical protein